MSENEEPSGFVPPNIDELSQGLPGYEFIDLLACGGMGAVYRARQTSLDRMVAIKILPPELAVDETFRRSFEAEGKAMAKVSHSNLVGVFNLGEVSDMLYLVMEFVEGSTLYQSKGDSAIDPETAVTLIRSVASGLAEAHRHDLVHRDIKPANIFINQDLVPKLGDFGLAVPDSDVESGLMMGTPAYLAPEVLENPTSASFASDTYALGVILYELLTGSSIERGDVMDLSRVPMIGDLQKIVRKAVNPQPLLRYQNSESLENDLKDWLRKPKTAGLTINPAGRIPQPRMVSAVPQERGGGGGLLLGLAAILIVGGLAWFAFGRGSDPDEGADKAIANPSTPVPKEPKAPIRKVEVAEGKTLEELRSDQQKTLGELSSRIAEERTKNRLDFIEAAGEEGEALIRLLPNASVDLPRYFLPGEVKISEGLLSHLQEFANSRQEEIDRKFRREISSLHRDAIRDLRIFKKELSAGVDGSWERWVEWLGRSPMKVMHTTLAGSWRFSSGSGGFLLHLSSTGKHVLVIGEERMEGEDLVEVSETGEISLRHSGDSVFHFPWKVRWLGDRLEGEDSGGERRLLRMGGFDYADLLEVPDKPAIQPVKMTEVRPDDSSPKVEIFKDPQVVTLTENYRTALREKIEKLESGYLRVLKTSLESYRNQDEETAVAQIEAELERVEALSWRKGFMQISYIPPSGELPSDVTRKQEVFRTEFKKRFEPLQRTYSSSLKRMLRERKGRGNTDLGDLEKALEKLVTPEGAVRARYVKIESLPDEGIGHATIANIEIVDAEGENLPFKKFSNVKASSFEDRDDHGGSSSPDHAIDGNPKTFWHSKWREPRAEFPHWLSFDLGSDHWLTGFRIVPRHYQLNRGTDVTNWRFYVSSDGENWSVVATGSFPKGNHTKEHLGLSAIE